MFTDIFIKRPVLAIVLSLLILVLGLRAWGLLPILQYPFTQSAQITVSTTYTGADPETIAAYITTPLENAIAQATGIDYMTSVSSFGTSTIQANLLLDYDPNAALTQVNMQVNSVLNQLPTNSQLPVMSVAIGESIDSMYLGFYSQLLNESEINDYLLRVVQPKLQAVNGVQDAQILGQRNFALRAWLDPAKLAAVNLSAADVASALKDNNFISASGRTDGTMFILNLRSTTDRQTLDQFKNLVVAQKNGAIIRLQDVATVTLGSQNYNTSVAFDGKSAVYIGIELTPSANMLTVIGQVRQEFERLKAQLPNGLNAKIVYDATDYVNSSIKDVVDALWQAFLIVTVVVFLFLGSVRALTIPTLAIPLSLIGGLFVMLSLGYSVNLLTLLAMVLAIGLVVDDAIIVVENVQRHMDEGKSPIAASLLSARELASPIIAISIVLIAVYVPIGFMGGLTGALFTEFAFTLAGTVAVSAVIALTLSPMMCAYSLKHVAKGSVTERFVHYIDHQFDRLKMGYHGCLSRVLDCLPLVWVFSAMILSSIYFLYAGSSSELAPQEDQGIILTQVTGYPNASLYQTEVLSKEVYNDFKGYPEMAHAFSVNGVNSSTSINQLNSAMVGMVCKPWDERKRTTNQIQPLLQKQLMQIAGAKIGVFQLPSLPGGGSGFPIQFVIQSTQSPAEMNGVAQDILKKAREAGIFMYLDFDLKMDQVQTTLDIDRDKASELGLNMKDVGNVLASALSQGYVNYFNYMGRSYQVIPQMMRPDRLNDVDILNYYITTSNGASVPLSTIVKLERTVVPETINHFQQLNSATLSAVAVPGVSMGRALETLRNIATSVMPPDYTIDYASQSRQFIQEGDALVATFIFALIIIYLSLAALFNSFRDPLIVMMSVPMSICGALIFIFLSVGGLSLNIYTEVGLVTLIGLISKHGILIVQFANDQQALGKSKREAIEMAASLRLRPILMTTAAMVLGVIPLIFATGAGAVSRFNLGVVIATGISIGTLFTLFVVPGVYMLLAEAVKPEITEAGLEPV
ncbi:MAG: multidrug efflux protein [Gammaproteobacteria bacterium RIFCSPHIGHO2_12_FULL_45_9]|nr:MAG: multidrug efflux protein [Gammaproteobacteria bacterium RIFCSPHIGHO2_12_FULL_45_9]